MVDLENAIENLGSGFALVTPGHAVIRRYDGKLVGIKEGCDEPTIRYFIDLDDAVEWMEKWRMNIRPDAASVTRQLPMDMDEVDFVLRAMRSGR